MRILAQAGLLTRGRAFTDAQVLFASKAVPGKRGFTDAASAAVVDAVVGCTGSPSGRKAALIGIELPRALMEGPPMAKALHQVRVLANRDDAE